MLIYPGVALFESIRRIRMCGLFGIRMAMLGEMCHLGVGFEISIAQARPNRAGVFCPAWSHSNFASNKHTKAYFNFKLLIDG